METLPNLRTLTMFGTENITPSCVGDLVRAKKLQRVEIESSGVDNAPDCSRVDNGFEVIHGGNRIYIRHLPADTTE